jgi:hypothetical protein
MLPFLESKALGDALPEETSQTAVSLQRPNKTRCAAAGIRRASVGICRGTDGLRPGAGEAPPLTMSILSASRARTVHDGAEGLLRSRPRSRLLGVISQKNVDQKLIFGAWMRESVVGRWMQSQETSESSFLSPTKP